MNRIGVYLLLLLVFLSCQNKNEESISQNKIRLVTVDPGHFHAALVQKVNYDQVDSKVHVYAPEGKDVLLHMDRIQGFNERQDQPTNWESILYTGADFFEKMIEEKAGNVVILAGNNQKKTKYINQAIEAGLNVLADKPMVITVEDFELLKKSFETAKKNGVLLYDVMTERFEITSLLQKELLMNSGIFGKIEKGTPDNPAVTKESVHHFFKYVAGNILIRPPWFFDVEQEGEGLVDVTTHLVDLVQWQCFDNQILSEEDVQIIQAERTPTYFTVKEFKDVTGLDNYPEYLNKYQTNDSTIAVFCNGEINYRLKDIHAKVSVRWDYKAPEGAKDTHFSLIRGTNANLLIKQGAAQNFKATLYIEARKKGEEYVKMVNNEFAKLASKYPGIALKEIENGWEVVIPEVYNEGHEAHFASVTERFINYLDKGELPDWEIPNMITKYYTTTKALEFAKSN